MPDIHGNLEGVRKSTIAELETLYDFPIDRDEYLPQELAKVLGRYSCALNREISLYVSRDGEVIDITVGDTASVPLSDIRLRRSSRRLSRVRCIHTHPRGSAELSDVDITALKSLWLDSMCALGVDTEGNITGVLFGMSLVGIINNAMLLMGVDSIYQDMIQGVLIVIAVALDYFSRKRTIKVQTKKMETKAA